MVIAACSPSIFFSPISEKLISKLESAPLDQSWIPETERLRHRKHAKNTGDENTGYETGVDDQGPDYEHFRGDCFKYCPQIIFVSF